jgi:glutamyl-tRNA reductase
MQDLIVVGANPRSSSLSARDRLIPEPAETGALLAELQARGLAQAMIMATCDRVEVYAVETGHHQTAGKIIDMLARFGALAPAEVERHLFVLRGDDAVRHVFTVAASLGGTIVGDPHVTAQFKDAYNAARRAGALGETLDGLVQAALAVAKQVRVQTEIGRAPVSLAAAAVELVARVHGDLGAVRALFIGLSELGELIARALRAAGLDNVAVAHYSATRAEDAARLLEGHVAAYPPNVAEMARADVVIGCLGSRRYVITPELVESVLRARRYQPILLIDIAVPGDVDPAINSVDAAFVYSLDDLERVARLGHKSRHLEAVRAHAIIDAEVGAFLRRRAERAAVPVLGALRRHFQATRVAVLKEADGDAEKATRLLINRLLHAPSTKLRAVAADAGEPSAELEQLAQALEMLFALNAADEENRE